MPSLRAVHGAFVNTATAQCSIYESGRMVYECIDMIPKSKGLSIDYFSLEEINIQESARRRDIILNDGVNKNVKEKYDFIVFNWHHFTMKGEVPADIVRLFPQKKFAIVLEVEPNDPLAFTDPDLFDGYIVLDPTAGGMGRNVFAFPRPLEGRIIRGEPRRNKIPQIGSFGFGTPGKGFELIVDAVNREFDEAKVRINIPLSPYADDAMFKVHNRSYVEYLESLCRTTAKPGITVEVTQDFMTPDALIDWCADNDLNCFLYSRRQSGLSATTDQAIASGQPLLVSTNDTFRHIHPYIPPYPLWGLRDAIEKSAPAVRRLQDDWSRETFGKTFLSMLECYGLCPDDAKQPSAVQAVAETRIPLVLVACDPAFRQYATRVADCLKRSGAFQVECAPYATDGEFQNLLDTHQPSAIILIPASGDGNLTKILREQGIPSVILDDELVPGGASASALDQGGLIRRPRPPVIPYFTSVVPRPAGPLQAWLVGFANRLDRLSPILDQIQREAPDMDIRVDYSSVMPTDKRAAFLTRLGELSAAYPALTISPSESTPFQVAEATVYTVSQASLVILAYDEERGEELRNLADLALTSERAVMFTRQAPFPAYADKASFVEDHAIPALVLGGRAGQMPAIAAFGEWILFAELVTLLRLPRQPRIVPFSGALRTTGVEPVTDLSSLLQLDKAIFVRRAYQALLGRPADSAGLGHYLEQMRRGVSRAYIVAELRCSAEGVRHGAKIPGLTAEIWRYRLQRMGRKIISLKRLF